MKDKTYYAKTRGAGKDKLYTIKKRVLLGLTIEDMVKLIGAEAACKLLRFYGGVSMYIPQVKTIQRRILDALLKNESARLLADGMGRREVVAYLSQKTGRPQNTIKMKLCRWFGNTEGTQAQRVKMILNDHLTQVVRTHYNVFKLHGII
ncbi:MAG: hypothetical protein OEV59_04690 [Deltaproteobacteria bacterium]|nr:hypothetical protein [Deltaproteobacteria bacterium]